MERIMATAAVIAVACAVSAVTLAMQASPVAALKATTDLASGKLWEELKLLRFKSGLQTDGMHSNLRAVT